MSSIASATGWPERGACQRLRQKGIEHAAVIQAGQHVGSRQPVQFLLRLRAPLRQAIERPAQMAEFIAARDVKYGDIGTAGADVFHMAVQPPQWTQQPFGDRPAEQACNGGQHGSAHQCAQTHAEHGRKRAAYRIRQTDDPVHLAQARLCTSSTGTPSSSTPSSQPSSLRSAASSSEPGASSLVSRYACLVRMVHHDAFAGDDEQIAIRTGAQCIQLCRK
jgi:hypothetical protein